MNNSIPTIDSNNIEQFRNMHVNKNNTQRFWLPEQTEDNNDKFYAGAGVQKIIITPDEARKSNNTKLIGLSVAGATIFTAGAIFLFLNGGPKGLSKGFTRLRNFFENKILNSKLNTGVAPNKIWLYLLKGTENALEHADALNNFTSFKDVLFKKIMGVTKFTGKIHDKITKLFEKIGRRSVTGAYKSTTGKFKEIKALTKNISAKVLGKNPNEIVEINGVKLTRQQWLDEINNLNTGIEADYTAHFGKKALNGRYLKMKHIVQDLYDNFKDMKIFLSTDTLTRFIAEGKLTSEKAALQKHILNYRQGISYSLNDMVSLSNNTIMDIVKTLGYKDTKDITQLGSIRGNIQRYVNGSATDSILKQQILDDISLLKHDIQLRLNNMPIKDKKADIILSKIDDLKSIIENFEEGKVEKILNIYKKLLPADRYDIVESIYKDGVKSLDKSIKIESEDFMSKLRDLTLGSAPTDILTILGSFGVLGYQLGKSKDNDQRQSIALKYGFPALAGIGVSLYCNAKLYAGTKSLLVGAVSTWILNRIGEWGDEELKLRKAKKSPSK